MGKNDVGHVLDAGAEAMTTSQRLQEMLCDGSRAKCLSGYHMLEQLPRIECVNGFSMSVQASRTHYCEPRGDLGPWHSVEIGYPSARVEVLLEFAEDRERPTSTVYAGVPIEVAAMVIDENGGMK